MPACNDCSLCNGKWRNGPRLGERHYQNRDEDHETVIKPSINILRLAQSRSYYFTLTVNCFSLCCVHTRNASATWLIMRPADHESVARKNGGFILQKFKRLFFFKFFYDFWRLFSGICCVIFFWNQRVLFSTITTKSSDHVPTWHREMYIDSNVFGHASKWHISILRPG